MQRSASALLLALAIAPGASAMQFESEWQWPWHRNHKTIANEAKTADDAKPASKAEQAAAADTPEVYPSTPGCFMRMPSGCPKRPMRTTLWRHDTYAEEQSFDESNCLQRKQVWDKYCNSNDAKMVFVAAGAKASKPLSTESSRTMSALQVGSKWLWPWSRKKTEQKQEATTTPPDVPLESPKQPGCFMRMPSGCPKHPMRTNLWRRDTYAEFHKYDEAGCYQRKRVWDKYCDTSDAHMTYVANSTGNATTA